MGDASFAGSFAPSPAPDLRGWWRFANFRGAPNSRVQSFSYFTSEPEDRFAPDLALLVSLIAGGSLKPRIGVEQSWRALLSVGEMLRNRRVAGKAVLIVDAQ